MAGTRAARAAAGNSQPLSVGMYGTLQLNDGKSTALHTCCPWYRVRPQADGRPDRQHAALPRHEPRSYGIFLTFGKEVTDINERCPSRRGRRRCDWKFDPHQQTAGVRIGQNDRCAVTIGN